MKKCLLRITGDGYGKSADPIRIAHASSLSCWRESRQIPFSTLVPLQPPGLLCRIGYRSLILLSGQRLLAVFQRFPNTVHCWLTFDLMLDIRRDLIVLRLEQL
jgi:hypothetical protein